MEETIMVVFAPKEGMEKLVIPVTYRKEVMDNVEEYTEEFICEVREIEGEWPEWLTKGEFIVTAKIEKDGRMWVVYPHFKDGIMKMFVPTVYSSIYIRDSYDAAH